MSKAYAVIDEEYSPAWELDCCIKDYGIIIDAGRHYYTAPKDALDGWNRLYENVSYYMENDCKEEARNDIFYGFYQEDRKLELKESNIEELLQICTMSNPEDWKKEQFICKCLSICQGKKYDCFTIKGCCQGDVARVYGPADLDEAAKDYIEACYFGTGTCIVIHDGDEISKPEDVSGYVLYVVEWGVEKLKDIVREETGCDEVTIWKPHHYVRTPVYEVLS